MTKISNENVPTSGEILKFKNQLYSVGYGDKNFNLNKTEDDFLKICILNICCRFMPEEYMDFKLLLTSPPLTYEEHRTTLPESLTDVFEVDWKDKHRIISISECTVFPETFTAYLANNPQNYVGKILYVWDIGGYSSSIVKITDGDFDINKDYLTITRGMYNIDTKTSDYLTQTIHLPCDLDDVYIYRKNNFEGMKINIKEIHGIYNELINELVGKSILKGWNMRNSEILVTGGGGMNLFEFIKSEHYPQAILSKDPIFDNLNGLDLIGQEMYGNESMECF